MRIFKVISTVFLLLLGLLTAVLATLLLKNKQALNRARSQLSPPVATINSNGRFYRDLNNNGRLDIYEDRTRPVDERVEDLLSQMTLEEKAGLMMQPMINAGKGGSLIERSRVMMPAGTSEMVVNRQIKHFNIVMSDSIADMANWYNEMQKLAEKTRLGIPVTISSDPRHSASDVPGTSIATKGFSRWPDPLGLAATRDENLVERFGDVARQEYLAGGIRTALHPMADLATEPRWARMGGCFGEDAALSSQMTAAYIRGFQKGSDGVGPQSVSCMVKHFPGGGPQKDGWDPHFSYGRDQVYPGDNFDYHLPPFEAAFAAGVEQVMPYYSIPVGQTAEDVAMSYNKEIVTGLLREKYGFEGVICTDWMIVEPLNTLGVVPVMKATAWGVEHLSARERYQKALDAGIDQFGGQLNPQHLIDLVCDGAIPESRLDASARRILRLKFKMGLFDNPYIDIDALQSNAGTVEFVRAGLEAQLKSVVLLKNENNVLPLGSRPKLYIENIKPEIANKYGDVVATPEEADLAILRLVTPYQKPRGRNILEGYFHQGDLDFKSPEKERILKILNSVPTIVDIYLERAAVFPEIAAAAKGVFGTFGVNDDVLLQVAFGQSKPTGKLPMELPSSMDAVRAQKEDVPYDSENPLFSFGFGLSYD
jgi:beta-glucosidase